MSPTGQAYSRSGPTEDTIGAIRRLRQNIEQQITDLDKTALSPLEQAKAKAVEATGAQGYQDPTFALRAAQRTAAAEERGVRRGDRTMRDINVLTGAEAAPLTEKAGALVRQGLRGGVGRVRDFLHRAPREGGGSFESSSPTGMSPEAPVLPPTDEQNRAAADLWQAARNAKTPEDTLGALQAMLGQVSTPDAYRQAADIAREKGLDLRAKSYDETADDMEYAAAEKARAGKPDDTLDTRLVKPRNPTAAQREAAQTAMETDVGTTPLVEDWRPQVPGRRAWSPQAGRDYTNPGGPTLAEVKGTGPTEAIFSMGDLGTMRGRNRFGGSSNPEVPFEQPDVASPARSPTATVETAPDFESTGGDKASREGPAKLQDVAHALQSFNEDKPAAQPAKPQEPLGEQDEKVWRSFIQTSSELPQGNTSTTMAVPGEVPFDPGTPLRRRQRQLVDEATQ